MDNISKGNMFEVDEDIKKFVESIKSENEELYNRILLGPAEEKNIKKAVEELASGGVVLFYSSATYGVAANAWDRSAVEKIYEIKGRDSGKPLTILTSKKKYKNVADLDGDTRKVVDSLVEKFWPGYVGIVCPKIKEIIPDYVNAGFDTINMTCMDSACEMLVDAADFPLAITSANYSGKEPARSAYEALEYFKDEKLIGIFLLGPKSSVGFNTTMVKVSDVNNIDILRPGPVSKEEIISVVQQALNKL